MKVIVNVTGFYGGTHIKAGPDEIEMNDKTAKQFLPPRGDQLSIPKAKDKPAPPQVPAPVATRTTATKKDD